MLLLSLSKVQNEGPLNRASYVQLSPSPPLNNTEPNHRTSQHLPQIQYGKPERVSDGCLASSERTRVIEEVEIRYGEGRQGREERPSERFSVQAQMQLEGAHLHRGPGEAISEIPIS